jgi:hypothetical protein
MHVNNQCNSLKVVCDGGGHVAVGGRDIVLLQLGEGWQGTTIAGGDWVSDEDIRNKKIKIQCRTVICIAVGEDAD